MPQFPSNTPEYLALVHELNQRLWQEQSASALFAAVLAANHVPDWHFTHDLGRRFKDADRVTFAEQYPEWETLRQLANGAKHAAIKEGQAHPSKLTQLDHAWGFVDGWDHLMGSPAFWCVEHLRQERSVFTLCRQFLAQFQRDKLTDIQRA